MRLSRIITVAVLVILVALLAVACSPRADQSPTPGTVAEVATALAEERAAQGDVGSTAAPTEAPTSQPDTSDAAEEPPTEVASESACINCHTDAETLQVLAVII